MFERLTHLEAKHYLLLVAFMASIGTVLSGVNTWGELWNPKVVGGLLGLLAVQISTIFTGAPPKPPTPPNP